MSKPIKFSCSDTLSLAPEEIARQILDVAKWANFRGYGPLPGIKSAEFETLTPNFIGSRIQVTSSDGSRHVEEIVEWQPERRIQLRMQQFSAPLSWMATRFVETWEFEREGSQTKATRSFELYPTSDLMKPMLWLISRLLKRAIARHLQDLKSDS